MDFSVIKIKSAKNKKSFENKWQFGNIVSKFYLCIYQILSNVYKMCVCVNETKFKFGAINVKKKFYKDMCVLSELL